jgi:hypothetical protein
MVVADAAAPRFALAAVGLLAPVPPSATARSVMPEIVPLVMLTPLALSTVIPLSVPPVMPTADAFFLVNLVFLHIHIHI